MRISSNARRFSPGFGCVDFSTSGANGISLAQTKIAAFKANVFTWSAWVYLPTAAPGQNTVMFDVDDGINFSLFFLRGGDYFPEFTNSNGTVGISNQVFVVNTWYFVFAQCDGTTTTCGYKPLNKGVVSASDAHVWHTTTTGLSIFLGEANGGDNFTGYMTDSKIYNYALSTNDLYRQSMQRAPLTANGLLSYLPMRDKGMALRDSAAGLNWSQVGTLLTATRSPPVSEVASLRRYPSLAGSKQTFDTIQFGEVPG